jgi:hypothetical protein
MLVKNFKERHAGTEENLDESKKMTVVNNPLIDKALNESFSPFYRLENMPKNMPCLFFHATDDKQVPVSESVDAFARINSAGGDARIIISSQGGHVFFKTGKDHNAEVMKNCFDAIDTLLRRVESAGKAVIDGAILSDPNPENVEGRILAADKTYENYSKALEEFHQGIERPVAGEERKRLPPKRKLLGKIADAHENIATRLERLETERLDTPVTRKNAEANRQKASLIKEWLKKS